MLNQDTKFIYESVIPIRWYDMDAYGHVNTSVYFTYFEQTRISWFIDSGLHFIENIGPVVVNANCSFLKPIVYPEIIVVKLSVKPPGHSSLETFYQIISKTNPDILYAEGYAKIVWVDRKAGHSVALPDELKKLLPEKNNDK